MESKHERKRCIVRVAFSSMDILFQVPDGAHITGAHISDDAFRSEDVLFSIEGFGPMVEDKCIAPLVTPTFHADYGLPRNPKAEWEALPPCFFPFIRPGEGKVECSSCGRVFFFVMKDGIPTFCAWCGNRNYLKPTFGSIPIKAPELREEGETSKTTALGSPLSYNPHPREEDAGVG